MKTPDTSSGMMPSRKFVLEFTKMSSAGNDFIVIDNRFYRFSGEELSTMAARWCPRRTGVGADGLLALSRPEEDGVQYRMQYYNADGSLGTMCGNGARCLAQFARDAGIEGDDLVFSSDAGRYRAMVLAPGRIRLFVPAPERYNPAPELETDHPFGAESCHYLWTGTEHLVVYVADVEDVDVGLWGPRLRNDAALSPNGANINFVEVGEKGDEARLTVRTFEKGVEAETLACGTGSIASSLVSALSRRSDARRYAVHMPGGVLYVGFEGTAEDPQGLYLEGPAESIYRGSLEM